MEFQSSLYRFNGQCDMSRDADFVLVFEDGTCLKTHSFILRKASPILAQQLQSPPNSTTNEGHRLLTMKNNDYISWCVILNYLYPGTLQNNESILLHDLVIEGVVREAMKYGMKSILAQIDREAAKSLYETKSVIELNLIDFPKAFRLIKTQERLMLAAAKFNLSTALIASNNCLASFLAGTFKYNQRVEWKNPEAKVKLDYKNSILTMESEQFYFADLIEAGYKDIFFRYRSLVLAYDDES